LSKGDEVKALIKLRCENWEQKNKYWLDEKYWKYMYILGGRYGLHQAFGPRV